MSKDKGREYLNSDDVNDTFNSEDDSNSWGYKYANGSGSYYGADDSSTYYDVEDIDEDEDTDSSVLVSDLVGLALKLGGVALANEYSKSKEKAHKDEETRLEQLRIEDEKRRIRQAEKYKKRKIRNKESVI